MSRTGVIDPKETVICTRLDWVEQRNTKKAQHGLGYLTYRLLLKKIYKKVEDSSIMIIYETVRHNVSVVCEYRTFL
jgi:hypothetical protein